MATKNRKKGISILDKKNIRALVAKKIRTKNIELLKYEIRGLRIEKNALNSEGPRKGVIPDLC